MLDVGFGSMQRICNCCFFEMLRSLTCPIRIREDWMIAEDAASFFFPVGTLWTSLTDIRLKDGNGLSAGNIDVVLVAYDERGKLLDFGSLEVQALYIGNVCNPFYHYMQNQTAAMEWSG